MVSLRAVGLNVRFNVVNKGLKIYYMKLILNYVNLSKLFLTNYKQKIYKWLIVSKNLSLKDITRDTETYSGTMKDLHNLDGHLGM